jgi:restriction endonuclease S subunit
MAYQKLQGRRALLVTPSDTDEIPAITGGTNNGCVLYIGTPGNLRVKTIGGDDVIFTGVYAGQFFPVQVIQVYATGTTAGEIVALW